MTPLGRPPADDQQLARNVWEPKHTNPMAKGNGTIWQKLKVGWKRFSLGLIFDVLHDTFALYWMRGCDVYQVSFCQQDPINWKKKHPWGYRLLLASALWMRLYNRFLKRFCWERLETASDHNLVSCVSPHEVVVFVWIPYKSWKVGTGGFTVQTWNCQLGYRIIVSI